MTGYAVVSSPTVVNGVVYFGSNNGNGYALDANTGAKDWSYLTSKAVAAIPAVVGGASLVMCVIGAFSSTFPVPPTGGRDIFNHSRLLWIVFFVATLAVFGAWLLLM